MRDSLKRRDAAVRVVLPTRRSILINPPEGDRSGGGARWWMWAVEWGGRKKTDGSSGMRRKEPARYSTRFRRPPQKLFLGLRSTKTAICQPVVKHLDPFESNQNLPFISCSVLQRPLGAKKKGEVGGKMRTTKKGGKWPS